MWQTEDLIRSLDFDIEKIEKEIISKYEESDEIKTKIREWYKNLIEMMDMENVRKKGHLQIIINIVIDMYDLHLRLLQLPQETTVCGGIAAHSVF